jgi:hypothetical protein
MPEGYEIYTRAGKMLVMRIRRWDFGTIKSSDLISIVRQICPRKEDGSSSVDGDFEIRKLTTINYEKSLSDQKDNDVIPKSDGTTETKSAWSAKYRLMSNQPDLE